LGNAQAGAPHQLLAGVGLDDPGQEGHVLLAFQPDIDDFVELKNRNLMVRLERKKARRERESQRERKRERKRDREREREKKRERQTD
jgi:hypothetical protein